MDKDLKYYKNLSEKLENQKNGLLSRFTNLFENKKYLFQYADSEAQKRGYKDYDSIPIDSEARDEIRNSRDYQTLSDLVDADRFMGQNYGLGQNYRDRFNTPPGTFARSYVDAGPENTQATSAATPMPSAPAATSASQTPVAQTPPKNTGIPPEFLQDPNQYPGTQQPNLPPNLIADPNQYPEPQPQPQDPFTLVGPDGSPRQPDRTSPGYVPGTSPSQPSYPTTTGAKPGVPGFDDTFGPPSPTPTGQIPPQPAPAPSPTPTVSTASSPNDDERNKFSQARSNYYRKMNQKAKDDAEERLAVIKTLDTSKMSAHGRAEVARNKLRAERALKRDKFTDEDISRMSASDTRERFLSPEEKKARAERNKAVVDQLVKDAERLKAGGQQQRGKEIADIQSKPGFVSGVAADMNKAVEAEMARRQAKSVSGYEQRALDKEEQEANEEEYENNLQRNRNKKAVADLYDMGPPSPNDEAENQVRAEYGMDPISPEDRERRANNQYEYEKQQAFNRRHGLPQKTYHEFLDDKKRMSQSEPVRPGITPGVAGPPSQNDVTQRIIIGPNGTPINLPRGVGVDENQPPLETVDTPLESPPSGGDVTDKAKTMSVEPGTTRTVPNTQQPNPRPTAAVQPSAATQTPPASAVGGDVTQRAATMNATAQTQQPASGSVSPTAPTMQAPRQPLGTQITPTARPKAEPQPYSTQPMNQPMELPPQEDDEQQSGGPTEVNRAIPTPSQNPMAAAVQQKPRGGAVTRAARTFRANARVA